MARAITLCHAAPQYGTTIYIDLLFPSLFQIPLLLYNFQMDLRFVWLTTFLLTLFYMVCCSPPSRGKHFQQKKITLSCMCIVKQVIKKTTRSETIVDVIFQCNSISLCYRVVLHNLD